MRVKSNIELENVKRMSEIAEVYEITKQNEKSLKYHKNIIKICDKFPKNEKFLQYKMHSLNRLNKPYKSLETTNELLNLNPNNLAALFNIAKHIKGESNV
jgi:tetratricopeptide (TPR) repeat protein